jgi:hypothetical protein
MEKKGLSSRKKPGLFNSEKAKEPAYNCWALSYCLEYIKQIHIKNQDSVGRNTAIATETAVAKS